MQIFSSAAKSVQCLLSYILNIFSYFLFLIHYKRIDIDFDIYQHKFFFSNKPMDMPIPKLLLIP